MTIMMNEIISRFKEIMSSVKTQSTASDQLRAYLRSLSKEEIENLVVDGIVFSLFDPEFTVSMHKHIASVDRVVEEHKKHNLNLDSLITSLAIMLLVSYTSFESDMSEISSNN